MHQYFFIREVGNLLMNFSNQSKVKTCMMLIPNLITVGIRFENVSFEGRGRDQTFRPWYHQISSLYAYMKIAQWNTLMGEA
jgi:hypothetical protein